MSEPIQQPQIFDPNKVSQTNPQLIQEVEIPWVNLFIVALSIAALALGVILLLPSKSLDSLEAKGPSNGNGTTSPTQNSSSSATRRRTRSITSTPSTDTNPKILQAKQERKKMFDDKSLAARINTILGQEAKQYGVYISVPQEGLQYKLNADIELPPASISKVPIAVLILRDVDKGKIQLKDYYPIKSSNKAYNTDPLYDEPNGTKLTVYEYLYQMLSNSDNTAMLTLEEVLGGAEVINKRTEQELEILKLKREPHISTAADIGKLMEGIYGEKYLTPESNNILLQTMIDIPEWLQNRIPKGLPDNVEIAHKIGEVSTDSGMAFNDAGIIFGSQQSGNDGTKVDYVLVIINQDIDKAVATRKMVQISQVVWQGLNK
jgi:beta-lactamase class A